jgi:hypothetical protein
MRKKFAVFAICPKRYAGVFLLLLLVAIALALLMVLVNALERQEEMLLIAVLFSR